MNKILLENILLLLIVIYVIYNFYKCHQANNTILTLEKFNNDDIEKLQNLKSDDKLNLLFNLYINILKLISNIMLKDNKIIDTLDLNKILGLKTVNKLKELLNNGSLKDILGEDLYERNIKLYNYIKNYLDDNNNNIIDMKTLK